MLFFFFCFCFSTSGGLCDTHAPRSQQVHSRVTRYRRQASSQVAHEAGRRTNRRIRKKQTQSQRESVILIGAPRATVGCTRVARPTTLSVSSHFFSAQRRVRQADSAASGVLWLTRVCVRALPTACGRGDASAFFFFFFPPLGPLLRAAHLGLLSF